jgi:hypothetical protein
VTPGQHTLGLVSLQEAVVEAVEEGPETLGNRQHPLAHRDVREDMVHEVGRGLGRALGVTGRAGPPDLLQLGLKLLGFDPFAFSRGSQLPQRLGEVVHHLGEPGSFRGRDPFDAEPDGIQPGLLQEPFGPVHHVEGVVVSFGDVVGRIDRQFRLQITSPKCNVLKDDGWVGVSCFSCFRKTQEGRTAVKTRNLAIVLVLMLMVGVDSLSAQDESFFGVTGGITKLTGEGSEDFNLGFNIGGEFFRQIKENLYVGGRAVYNRIGVDTDEMTAGTGVDASAHVSIIELLPTIRFSPPAAEGQSARFFGQAGVGLYMMKVSAEAEGLTVSADENKFGVNLGVGVIINDQFTIFPGYNIIFTEYESTKYFSVSVGVLLGN